MPVDNLPPVKDSDFRTRNWRTNPNEVAEMGQALRDNLVLKHKDHIDKTIGDGIGFLKKVAAKLMATDLDSNYCSECERSGPTPESLGKTFSYVAKTIDEITRLMEFSAGRADSRKEVGFSDLARYLTNEQFTQVMTWVSENQYNSIDITPR
jgi:hypothetical protein